jgi:hypothetical protein
MSVATMTSIETDYLNQRLKQPGYTKRRDSETQTSDLRNAYISSDCSLLYLFASAFSRFVSMIWMMSESFNVVLCGSADLRVVEGESEE